MNQTRGINTEQKMSVVVFRDQKSHFAFYNDIFLNLRDLLLCFLAVFHVLDSKQPVTYITWLWLGYYQ